MITIWTIYLLAAVAASGLYMAAGWRIKRVRNLSTARDWQGVPADPLWADAEIDIDAPEAQADVGAAIRLVLKRLAPVMAKQSVQAEIAVPSGLLVRMKSGALTDLLEELVASAIHCAPGSRLLMTATLHGNRIHVGVTDDMPGTDLALRESSVRGLMERVAMRGFTLDINIRPTEGTTMILRLASVPDEDRHPVGPATTVPATLAALPVPADQ